MIDLRIGHGYDVHRLVEGRPLIWAVSPFPMSGGCWATPMRMYWLTR